MPSFSAISLQRLATCDDRLQRLLHEVIKHYDFSVLCGHRNEEDQTRAFLDKKSHVQWPNSKHNTFPSQAVDIAPYPINWKDTARFYHLGGFVRGIATSMHIRIRCGHDWDGDTILDDQKFVDLPHIELIL